MWRKILELNVLYSTDENYARHCAASLYSLLENNKEIEQINVYIIENKLSNLSKEKINDITKKFNRNLEFLELEKFCCKFDKNNNYSMSYYARLFLSNLPNNMETLLYIDCDTIINDSVEELLKIDISQYYLGAVQDSIQVQKIKFIGRGKEYRYINSGVLLINLNKFREDKIEEKFLEFINKYYGNVPHHDQGILNGVCGEKILYLDPKYNLMPEMIYMNSKQIKKLYGLKYYYTNDELKDAIKKPVIIHFLTKWYNRPWYKSCTHPMKQLYIKYLNLTKFDNKLLDGDIKGRIKLQKEIFEKMPFCVFLIVQKIFDIRRIILSKLNIRKRD